MAIEKKRSFKALQLLQDIFSNNIVITNHGKTGKTLKFLTKNIRTDASLSSTFGGLAAHGFSTRNNSLQTLYQYSRNLFFIDYEQMDRDSIISSALDIYADECTTKNTAGDILKITCKDDHQKKILENLYYDILNIDFNLWPTIRNMCKYGDHFYKLNLKVGIGVHSFEPLSAYQVERVEEYNNDGKLITKFLINDTATNHHTYKQHKNISYNEYEISHFRLLADTNFLPYGRSMLEPGRKVWKSLSLMEDAMLINRIMRAPERRVIKLDMGGIPPSEQEQHVRNIAASMKKLPYINEATGDYDLRFNLMNMLEDIFLPVRGDKSGTEISTLDGLQWTGIEDIEYLKNRLLASLKIPKAFLGYDEAVGGKATLAAEDLRFARTIERLQLITESELKKIGQIHLALQGYERQDISDFALTLNPPSTIHEQQKIELYMARMDLIMRMQETKMISEDMMYKDVLEFTDDDIEKNRKAIEGDIERRAKYEKMLEPEDESTATIYDTETSNNDNSPFSSDPLGKDDIEKTTKDPDLNVNPDTYDTE